MWKSSELSPCTASKKHFLFLFKAAAAQCALHRSSEDQWMLAKVFWGNICKVGYFCGGHLWKRTRIFFQAYLPAPDWLGVWLSWKHPAKLSLWKIVFLFFCGNKFNFVIIFQKRVENLKVESKLLHEAESNINLPGGQCKRITLWKLIWTDLQGNKCSDCYHISQFSTICIVAKICNFKTLPFAKSEPRHDKDKAPRHSILPLASDDKRECHSLNGETAMLSSMADCPMIVRKSRTQLMRLRV